MFRFILVLRFLVILVTVCPVKSLSCQYSSIESTLPTYSPSQLCFDPSLVKDDGICTLEYEPVLQLVIILQSLLIF